MSRDWSTAREFGRSMQSLHLLQEANSGDLSGDDILFLLNVNEIPADAQPKKVSLSGLADASGPFVVAGSNTQIQYNDNGDFGASSDLTWDDSGKELSVGGDINLNDGGTYETTVQVVTPTANRTISFPDATGTVALVAGSSGQLIWNSSGAQAGVTGSTVDGSGNVTLTSVSTGLGTAGAPTHSFTGDPNTGIYSPGADQVAISTNGTGRLFVDSSGNVNVDSNTLFVDAVNNRVAIGTNSPAQALGIAGLNGTPGNFTGIAFQAGGSEACYLRAVSQDSSNFALSFGTFSFGLSEKVRLTSDGRLGLGISDPGSLNAVLAVQKNQTADTAIVIDNSGTSGASTTSSFIVADGGATRGWFRRYRDGTGNTAIGFTDALLFEGSIGGTKATRMVIDSSGNVGIGTASPVSNTGYGGITMNGADGAILSMMQGGSETFRVTNATGYSFINTTGATPLLFGTGANERARIDSSGRLLVGTSSSPSASQGANSKLVVEGYVGAPTSGGIISLQRGQASASIANDQLLGRISFNGSDGYSFADITARTDGTAGVDDYPGALVFSTTADGASSPTERMRITSGGTALIGTSTSNNNARLGVAGSTHIGAGPNSVSLANGATGTVITPARGYSYINVSHSNTASDGLLLLVFANTITLTIVSTVHSNAGSRYSVAASGRDLQVTNALGGAATFYASCMTLAWGDNG